MDNTVSISHRDWMRIQGLVEELTGGNANGVKDGIDLKISLESAVALKNKALTRAHTAEDKLVEELRGTPITPEQMAAIRQSLASLRFSGMMSTSGSVKSPADVITWLAEYAVVLGKQTDRLMELSDERDKFTADLAATGRVLKAMGLGA